MQDHTISQNFNNFGALTDCYLSAESDSDHQLVCHGCTDDKTNPKSKSNVKLYNSWLFLGCARACSDKNKRTNTSTV